MALEKLNLLRQVGSFGPQVDTTGFSGVSTPQGLHTAGPLASLSAHSVPGPSAP